MLLSVNINLNQNSYKMAKTKKIRKFAFKI